MVLPVDRRTAETNIPKNPPKKEHPAIGSDHDKLALIATVCASCTSSSSLLPTCTRRLNKMGVAFDKCDTRPAHIDAILNGLDRYNPETTTVFQDYVVQQCEERTFDCYANLALLKL